MRHHISDARPSGVERDSFAKIPESAGAPKSLERRRFLKGLGAATAAAGFLGPTLAASSAKAIEAPTLTTQSPFSLGHTKHHGPKGPPGRSNNRLVNALQLRLGEAQNDFHVGPAVNVDNGDNALYADKGGTFTKALPHDDFGRVDLNAFASFTKALNSGSFADFQNITMGGTGTLNGPQGGLCFSLETLDGVQFGQPIVPPAPTAAGDQTATELLEHYWASLIRDVPFADYASYRDPSHGV